MKREIIAFFIVCALVFSNILGLIFVDSKNEMNSNSDIQNLDEGEPVSTIKEQDLNHIQDQLSEKPSSESKIDWSLLSTESNPSVNLFSENRVVGIEFKLPDMDIEQTPEGEIIHLEDCEFLLEPGKPLVPECRFFVAVPSDSKVVHVNVVEKESHRLNGYHLLAHYIPRTMDGYVYPTEPNFEIYSSCDAYPSIIYSINGPDKLRHLEALEVVIYPISYKPKSGIVEIFDLIRIQIDLEFKEGKCIQPKIPEDDDLDKAVLDLIVNPENVKLSSTYDSITSSGTRAPSTIYHTLGFHGNVDLIHPVKDNTTGNVGGATLLNEDDDDYYDAEAGKTLYVDGFDINTANTGVILEYAMLHIQYKGPAGYTGDSKVRWAVEGQPLSDTTIQPEDLNDTESGNLSYNLLGHAGSPSTVSDIADLDIEFSENGVGGGSMEIPFDYIWIEFAYREEMTGDSEYLIITDFAFADELRILAEWKTNRLNIETQVYDTDWINANCEGSDLLHRIYDFVKSMFENYSVEYVLLGGDENVVPTNYTHNSYDSFYANVVGFVYPDLAIGRLCTDSDFEMEGMVDDILVHQRDLGQWKRNVYLIGTNVFDTGDGKEDMEYAKENYLLGLGHTFYEDYEVEGNITRSRTITTYNQGMGLSIITGHGSKYGWYKNNGTQNFFNRNDVENSMNNSDKRGFVWSSTCSSGGFVGSYICIGEMWVRARNGGGIGYIGAGEIAFYSSTMWLYRRFYEAYNEMMITGKEPTQGVAHMKALNKINYRIYNLFGDPQVGLSVTWPKTQVSVGSFASGGFEEQIGFEQTETVTFNMLVNYPRTALPRGAHFNFTIQNEAGETYYPNEIYVDDPDDSQDTIFLNWTVPAFATSGIYNFSIRIYNTSQMWEFTEINNTYFFVDYYAELVSCEQLNSEVIEQDTVTYKIHLDNLNDPIPSATLRVILEGRDYDPFMTPFDYFGINITMIPSGLDVVVEVKITIPQPGTYNVSCTMHLGWALMDSIAGNKTEVRGIRILNVTYNHPIYFREDTVNVSFRYFAFSDFTGNTSIFVEYQTDQLYESYDFYNGTEWINFTWEVPKYLPNKTYDIDLEIYGLGRCIEARIETMRVIVVREILDLGEEWILPRQFPNGGWNESEWWWGPSTCYNETARAMQALLWSGVEQSDPVIQDAADYIENNINLTVVKRIDKLAEVVWALVDAGRGSSPEVADAGVTIRKMQNWVYEPETWSVYFEGAINSTWLANISGYDDGDSLIYWYEYNGTFVYDWQGIWINFSVLPDTVKLNVTLKTNHTYFLRQVIYPPYYDKNPSGWDHIWMNDHQDSGDGILWNRTCSEEFEFDRGWGERKGIPSIAGFTAWAVMGLIQAGTLGSYETDALYSGVAWLLDNQSADGSWYPYAFDGRPGLGGGYAYPGGIVGNWAEDYIQNTAICVIALEMNGTTGLPLDNGVSYLKTRQDSDGSYPWMTGGPWYHEINLISTAYTLRALGRTGHVFRMDSDYVKEAVRWLCAAQNQDTGSWDIPENFTRVTSEAMLALACLRFQRTMDLEPGWNLISLNLELEDTSLVSVLSSISGDYDAVQWYDTSDLKDPWKHYQISKPAHLNDLAELNYTRGIWIHITNPAGATFYFNGMEHKRNPKIELHKGWNLVGYPSLSNRNRELALNNIGFGTDISIIQWFDASSDSWNEVTASDWMEVGRGYWVYSNVEKTWEVSL